MTDITIYHSKIVRFRAVVALAIVVTVTAGFLVGSELQINENCIILPRSVFAEYSFFEAMIRLCFWDTVCFWLLSLPMSKVMTVSVTSVVFLFRGAVLGCGFRTVLENSVAGEITAVLLAYSVVTLLAVIYDGFINTGAEKGALSRLISCFTVTGACAVIRALPMLLI